MMQQYSNFTAVNLNMERVNALYNLMNACHYNGVKISKVMFFRNGFSICFEGFDGDAVLHDGTSYNHDTRWETMGFPWDGNDVSKHSAVSLARMIAALKRNDDWRQYRED